MIKWIANYFQNKSDARKNMMVPTRKPSVKIKLKSINFKKNSPGDKKEQVKQPKPNISSSFVDVSAQKEKPTPPPKPFTGKRLKTDKLKEKVYAKNNGFSFTALMFIIAVLFCLTSVGYVYASNVTSERQEILDECQSEFVAAIDSGYDLQGANCNIDSGGLDIFDVEKAQEALDAVRVQSQAQERLITEAKQSIDKEIATTLKYLEYFEVTPAQLPNPPEVTNNFNDTITNKEQYLTQLQNLLQNETGTLDESLEQFKFLLDTNPSLDLSEQREFYNDYIEASQEEQYAGYQALVLELNELIDTISSEQDNPFVVSGLADDEITSFKFFSGEEFKNTYLRTQKPGTIQVDTVNITGDNSADKRIIQIAVDRGYQLQVTADTSLLVSVENELLHPDVAAAYEEMKTAAALDGVNIGLVSGYRSVDTQQGIFLSRFAQASIAENGSEFDERQIAAGEADDVIDSVLQTSSIPGYSRHHSGYAIDLRDNKSANSFTLFKDTEAFDWLEANNYFNAKRFGFIPSYPEGATNQGPDPEAWEYVYVGVDVVKK